MMTRPKRRNRLIMTLWKNKPWSFTISSTKWMTLSPTSPMKTWASTRSRTSTLGSFREERGFLRTSTKTLKTRMTLTSRTHSILWTRKWKKLRSSSRRGDGLRSATGICSLWSIRMNRSTRKDLRPTKAPSLTSSSAKSWRMRMGQVRMTTWTRRIKLPLI